MRGGFKITRGDYYEVDRGDQTDLLDNFLKNLEAQNETSKSAVEISRNRNQPSFYDQISAVVGSPPISSVEKIVQDMQKRTGLNEYLKRHSTIEEAKTKTAQEVSNDVFAHLDPKLKESILSLIKNKIQTAHGNISIPAIQHEILSIFQTQGVQPKDINTQEVAKVISDLLLEETGKNPGDSVDNYNLGRGVGVTEDDDNNSNSDFFKGLLPATSK